MCSTVKIDAMTTVRNLLECSPEQAQAFLDSFDVVLSDCDGVLWHLHEPVEGAVAVLQKLQDLGKRVYLVSNNSTLSMSTYCKKIRSAGLDVKEEQIIITSKVIAWYLKKIKFHGEAFAIASTPFREILHGNGIKLTEESIPHITEEDQLATIKAIRDRPSVKAVVADFHMFADWGKLALAVSCLQRKDVLYLCGAQDEWVIVGAEEKVLGPGPLIDVITKQTGRAPIECAKPSKVLRDYILEECKVDNPKRCLFIGDTVNYDMKFGTMCGFLKLFVETGLDNVKDAKKSAETCPNFYIPSLGQLSGIINALQKNPINNNNS